MPHRTYQRIFRPKLSAFTLIELMAVIAIIGVLAALLLSGLGRLRESGRSATCLSNLRQQGMAIYAYAADHKGFGYPVYTDNTGGVHWGAQIHMLVAGGYVNAGGCDSPSDPIQSAASIFRCPSGADDKLSSVGGMMGAQGTGPDDPELDRPGRWLPDPAVAGGIPGTKTYYDSWYSWNADNVDTASLPLSPKRLLNTISRPAQTILVLDGPASLHLSYTRVSARHGANHDRINVLFADDHVAAVKINDLFDPATQKTTASYIWTVK